MEITEAPPGRREKRKQEIRTRIEDAAYRLFRTQGIEDTSIEQICVEADVARRTFYGHFTNKHALLGGLGISRLYNQSEPMLRQLMSNQQTTRGRLEAMIDYIEANFSGYEDIDRQLILIAPSAFAEDREQQREIGNSSMASFTQLIKRLLAAGAGPIYQIARAFRDGEAGRRHNPEFSLLEWYQPGFDHHQLMSEVADLVGAVLAQTEHEKISYQQLFLQLLDLDPLNAEVAELEAQVRAITDPGDLRGDRDCWLNLLVGHAIEPALQGRGMVFVYDYPASQAALARVDTVENGALARRFELYVDGLELANGYYELTDAAELRTRFERDNSQRLAAGMAQRPLDEALLAGMTAGLPQCSGVALGLDRLLMLQLGLDDIRQTMSFSWDRC